MMRSCQRRPFVFLFIVLIVFSAGCSSLFFYPQKQLVDNPFVREFNPQDIFFKTHEGLTLHGWFFKAPAPRGTILVLHGNAENLSTHVNGVLWLVKEGFNLFIFDYRGYGRSEGKPGIPGIHLDAEAALETALALSDDDDTGVIVLGQSLGGAVAVHTVANFSRKNRIRALVVESAFSSYRRIAREKLSGFFLTWPFQYPLSLLFRDDYSPVRWIGGVAPVPVLIIHGERDPVVPARHGRVLYDAAAEPREFWLTKTPGHIASFADEGIRKKLAVYLSLRSANP